VTVAETYKYQGSREPGRGSGPLILKGSIVNPEEVVEIGETVELTEEEAKEYRSQGLKLSKSDGADEPENATAGESGQPETRQQQQRAQRPSNVDSPGSGQAEK
jgi:hypothetical protein